MVVLTHLYFLTVVYTKMTRLPQYSKVNLPQSVPSITEGVNILYLAGLKTSKYCINGSKYNGLIRGDFTISLGKVFVEEQQFASLFEVLIYMMHLSRQDYAHQLTHSRTIIPLQNVPKFGNGQMSLDP